MNPINATQAYAGHTAEAAYSRWAPVYDLIFDLPFHPGRAAAARAAAEAAGPGGEILVVGVGTGLELPLLPDNVLVTGIDISAPMLRAARARVERMGLAQVKGLHVMDAAALEFPDAAFDVTLAPYVMSVVPDPGRALDEAWRVAEAGRRPDRHEPFRRARGTSRRRRAPDGDGRRLARLASELPLFDGRRLDRLAPRRAHRRAQRACADETVHAAQDRESRRDVERPAPAVGQFRLVSSARRTYVHDRALPRPSRSGSLAESENSSARSKGRSRRGRGASRAFLRARR